jgi:putative cardiolipin synthase
LTAVDPWSWGLAGFLLVAAIGAGWLLRLFNPLPPLHGRQQSHAMRDTGQTRLAKVLAPAVEANPGLTGVVSLPDGRDSFAARVRLVRAAERCIDLQYYIWQKDISGLILLEEVRLAAERGVRVRLLVDDNGTAGLDAQLAALDAHPDVEVRLFNPFTIRRPKALGYLLDFRRLNRRMHNKSLTVDGQATIVGGRNVGDAYFGASRDSLFADLDVLAVGAIVPQVSDDFDRYWASPSSYRISDIVAPLSAARIAAETDRSQAALRDPLAKAYGLAVSETRFGQFLEGADDFEWVPVRMVSDDPAKGLGKASLERTLMGRMLEMLDAPERQFGLVSAYFVPTKAGRRQLVGLARRGVQVSILTNALNATDVAVVHAGYAKHRRALLKAGVQLFELKGEGKARLVLSGLPGASRGQSRPVFRSQGTSLHAKTFTIDREQIFIGSFNFDPRSALLNTELGFVIESKAMAGALQDAMDSGLAEAAYAVRLAPGGRRLEWVEQTDGSAHVHRREPNSGPIQRGLIALLSKLPIDWML